MNPLLPFGATQPSDHAANAMLLARAPVAAKVLSLRSPTQMAVFSAATFGLYGLYWLYRGLRELRDATGDQSIAPLRAVMLTVLTFTLYAHVYLRARNAQLREWMQEGEETNLGYASALVPGVGALVLIAWFQTRLNRLSAFAALSHGHAQAASDPWVDPGN